ncbi:MAG: primosomal protein N' [Planctomycetaceae bacterium]|nr:primosomal protein N' [Planctomycetaceae bacterium]
MKQQQLFEPEPLPWEQADRDDLLCAQVVFNRPLETPFDYLIPDSMRGALQVGQRVKVPFGRGDHLIVGYCVGVDRPRHSTGLKSVHALVDARPILTPQMLELTRWIAGRYLCSWGQVLDTVVPAGVKNRAGTREVLLLSIDPEEIAKHPEAKLPPKQVAVLKVLEAAGQPLPLERVAREAGCGTAPITALRRKRFIKAIAERTQPGEADAGDVKATADLILNSDQQRVLTRVLSALREQRHQTFLLHGVTGSGKTEVYIRAIREVVGYGRQAIVLVPEISLTPQTIRRFRSRFDSVAVLHSHLSDADRHRHWQQIASGQVQVVVGARSAVFAPTPHLGLIVIDEEHENSFKQDSIPRYHAREVAQHRAELESVPLILGSATPTLESWRRAQLGQDELLQMPRRVEGLPMPPVIVVDIRNDPIRSSGGAIGRALRTAMINALDDDGQVILFLNLRGYSPVLWCRACGAAVKCPHCDISLTWHKERQIALCHSCDFSMVPPRDCPACGKAGVQYIGVGTQRLEQEVRAKFPKYPCVRMDSDSMRKPGSHDRALESFRHGEMKILLGTQMISKGLDFPNVTLVGVIDADTMLHQPDLRAAERTFQLIAQVAGRTGRSRKGGRVLVQTACPAEPSILFASRHDYVGFAQAEIEHRRLRAAPPFEHLARVIIRGPDEALVKAQAQTMVEACLAATTKLSVPVRVLGPAPAPVARLKGSFRYHFQLSAVEVASIQQLWREVAPTFKPPAHVEFAVDMDPLNLR